MMITWKRDGEAGGHLFRCNGQGIFVAFYQYETDSPVRGICDRLMGHMVQTDVVYHYSCDANRETILLFSTLYALMGGSISRRIMEGSVLA